jgi:hypothetical protein
MARLFRIVITPHHGCRRVFRRAHPVRPHPLRGCIMLKYWR